MESITVILCTYNRCESLRTALDSIANSILPARIKWEVLVVDNNSSDQTREVAESFCRQYAERFRYLFESRQGKSHALNSGIREARGEVLVFTDDDVTVDPTWLQNLTTALSTGEWAGAGGRIGPNWPCDPPTWLPWKEWYGMAPLVMFNLGDKPRSLTDAPFGANMAFHRRAFEKYGLFRTDLGPGIDGKIRNNEDTEFGRRLLAAGERLRYEPAAVVHHSVSQDRLRKEYFLTWWFNKSRADVQESRISVDRQLAGKIPLDLIPKLVFGTLRWMVTLGSARRFSRKLAVWSLAGVWVESWRQSRLSRGERANGLKSTSGADKPGCSVSEGVKTRL